MNKSIFTIIILSLISTIAISQGIKSEIHLSPGFETSIHDPFRSFDNQGGNPSFAFQLSYQLIFKHVGFAASLEFVKRNIDLKSNEHIDDINSEYGQVRADRFMLYFVGRAGKEGHKLNVDLRFGLGRLLKNEDYYFNSPIDLVHVVVPGLCFASAVKVNYKLSKVIGIYLDSKASFIPYNYNAYMNYIWYQEWQTRSSYLLDLGFYFGINILLNPNN